VIQPLVEELVQAGAGEQVDAYRRRGRRYHSYARSIGGGLYANVVDGRLAGFGVEPVADVVVALDGQSQYIDRRPVPVLAWAAPLGAAAAAGAAVATGYVLRRTRHAA
jgi:hypothetical protein